MLSSAYYTEDTIHIQTNLAEFLKKVKQFGCYMYIR